MINKKLKEENECLRLKNNEINNQYKNKNNVIKELENINKKLKEENEKNKIKI